MAGTNNFHHRVLVCFCLCVFFLMLQTGREFAYLSVAPLLDTGFDAQCSGIECDPGCGWASCRKKMWFWCPCDLVIFRYWGFFLLASPRFPYRPIHDTHTHTHLHTAVGRSTCEWFFSQVAIKDLEPIKVRYTSRRSQLESAPRRSRDLGLGPFMIRLNKFW